MKQLLQKPKRRQRPGSCWPGGRAEQPEEAIRIPETERRKAIATTHICVHIPQVAVCMRVCVCIPSFPRSLAEPDQVQLPGLHAGHPSGGWVEQEKYGAGIDL